MNKSSWIRSGALLVLAVCARATASAGETSAVGPLVGTVTTDEAWFLYRAGDRAVPIRLIVSDPTGRAVATVTATGAEADDYVAKFRVSGLKPDTAYTYRVETPAGVTPPASEGLKFRTALPGGKPGVVTAAFVSCANPSAEKVWARLGTLAVDRLFLMGDTPYIDNGKLAVARAKHRDFLSTPNLAALVRRTPTMGTWDDHDFGANNGNGLSLMKIKPNTRKAFVEYRAHAQYGTGKDGVYHKLDLGVMEVFLLDPRWFSETAPSPVDPAKLTCYGAAQWRWLLDGLKASRAPFKVLAFGEVWQDKGPTAETDDMYTYVHERDALFDFIRDERIPGVCLLGGDIHLSRHLVHPDRVGYDLHDFVTSPAHASVIPMLNVPHPDLEWSCVKGHQFLTLTADTRPSPATLVARYYTHDGEVRREVPLTLTQLTPAAATAGGRPARGRWDFDGHWNNRSVLGDRANARPARGAKLVDDPESQGGVVDLPGGDACVFVPRSVLDDNASACTLSLWCRPAALPPHGSTTRAYLAASTLGRDFAVPDDRLSEAELTRVTKLKRFVGESVGGAIDVAFRADASDAAKVVLEVKTNTVAPARGPGASPMAVVQGPWTCRLDRTRFTNRWAQVAVTFDSVRLSVFVDGERVATHPLPIPGPVSEFSGLVLGGPNTGVGENLTGKLDAVTVWPRALSPEEVAGLHRAGRAAR